MQASGRYRLHDLIRLFALEHADRVPGPDRDAAIDRVLDLYFATARRVHEVLLPGRPVLGAPIERRDVPPAGIDSMADANSWLDGELPNLLAAAQFAVQTEHAPLFPVRLSNSLHMVLGKRAAWAAERQLAELAVGATATRGERRDHIDAVRALGQAELHAGNFTDATDRLTEAVELSRSAGERRPMFRAMLDLGQVALQSGDLSLALSRMTECLEITRTEGWAMSEAITLLNISSVHVARRRWDDAREALEASLRVRRERGDVAGLSVVLPALAYVEFELGDSTRALELCAEGLQACRTVGNDVDGWFAVFCRSGRAPGHRVGTARAAGRGRGDASLRARPAVRDRLHLSVAGGGVRRRREAGPGSGLSASGPRRRCGLQRPDDRVGRITARPLSGQ